MVARATVIIPTFGQAEFALWSIKSVQSQTVKDIEICIICDGSPENMVDYFKAMAQDDSRIKIFAFPKGPRHGEIYRDAVIKQNTQGRIICYCAHDDLWYPDHIEKLEKILDRCCFAHTVHVNMNLPEQIEKNGGPLFSISYVNLDYDWFVNNMLAGRNNYFGLTNVAHTRYGYSQLKEGWTTTPEVECGMMLEGKRILLPTDFYMWNKFLAAYPGRCKTLAQLTALHFPISYTLRRTWPAEQRYKELNTYFLRIQDPLFLAETRQAVDHFYRKVQRHFLRKPRNFLPVIRKAMVDSFLRSICPIKD